VTAVSETTGTGSGPVAGRVLLVCSTGGHLAQLVRLRPWWEGRDRAWVTFDKSDARSLLAGERVYYAHHPTTRNLKNLVRNTALAHGILRKERPALVVSSGAGVAVPFFWMARRHGAATAYCEVYDRIDSSTLTGRLCYRFADLFALQWEEQRAHYPKGVVVGPLL
jgi:UDP-N-acetylglucosamine:LPS N-acetylglucosamine transferase